MAQKSRPDPIVGRHSETALLAGELEMACSRTPRVVLLCGDAGMGKTFLVDRFLQDRPQPTVLEARGEAIENRVELGLLGQLLRPRILGDVARPHAGAIDEPGSALEAGRVLLAALVSRAARSPLVLRIEDTQWSDPQSLVALVYAVRRLGRARVLVLVTWRTTTVDRVSPALRRLAEVPSGRTLLLDGLADRDLAELVRHRTGVEPAPAAARRLGHHTRGNPLLATALLDEFGAGWLQGHRTDVPVPREYAALIDHRLERCSVHGRRLVAAAAVLGDGAGLGDVVTVAGIDDGLAAIDEATRTGLLGRHGAMPTVTVRMSHPLDRAAVLRRMDLSERAVLHARAEVVTTDADARLEHAVRATTGPDAALSARVASHAAARQSHGALSAAASWFGTAASVAPSGARREALLLAAAETALAAGQAGTAAEMLTRLPPDAGGVRRIWLEGWLAFDDARLADARRLLAQAWAQPPADPTVRAGIAMCSGHLAFVGGDFPAAGAWGRRATRADPRGMLGATGTALDAVVAVLVGDSDRALTALDRVTGGAVPDAVRGHTLAIRANVLTWLGRLEEAGAAFQASLPMTERFGQFHLISQAWSNYGELLHRTGRWDEAEAAARTAIDYVEDCRHDWAVACVHALAVSVAARRGGRELAEERTRRSLAAAARLGDEVSLVFAASAGMTAAHAAGDHDAVLRAAEPLLAVRGRHDEPGVLLWQPLYAEALVRTGRIVAAEAVVDRDEQRATMRGRPAALAGALRVRGLLLAERGEGARSVEAFRSSAGQAAAAGMPFEKALASLYLGEHLLRTGNEAGAVVALEDAAAGLSALAAEPFLDRARRGVAHAMRRGGAVGRSRGLTSQERAVAVLVAEGLTNVEVAGRLTVGVKTVEFHLANIYRKTGVRSRSQLTRLLLLGHGSVTAADITA